MAEPALVGVCLYGQNYLVEFEPPDAYGDGAFAKLLIEEMRVRGIKRLFITEEKPPERMK